MVTVPIPGSFRTRWRCTLVKSWCQDPETPKGQDAPSQGQPGPLAPALGLRAKVKLHQQHRETGSEKVSELPLIGSRNFPSRKEERGAQRDRGGR